MPRKSTKETVKKTLDVVADVAKETAEVVVDVAKETASATKVAAKKVSKTAKESVESKPAVQKAVKETKKAAKKVAEETKKAADETIDAAKKAATRVRKPKVKTYVQYMGKEVDAETAAQAVKEAYEAAGNDAANIKSIALYFKPEEDAVYYVINNAEAGVVRL